MKDKRQIEESARIVSESLKEASELTDMKIVIDVRHIYSTDMRGKYWWKAPIVPRPWPRRRTLLYEALSEIEEKILEKYDLDVSIYLGASEPIAIP